jgi:hypothetical protein
MEASAKKTPVQSSSTAQSSAPASVIKILRITTPNSVKTVMLQSKAEPVSLTLMLELDFHPKNGVLSIRDLTQKVRQIESKENVIGGEGAVVEERISAVKDNDHDDPDKKKKDKAAAVLRELRKREIFSSYQKELASQVHNSSGYKEGGLLIDVHIGTESPVEDVSLDPKEKEKSKQH